MLISSNLRSWQRGAPPAPVHPLRLRHLVVLVTSHSTTLSKDHSVTTTTTGDVEGTSGKAGTTGELAWKSERADLLADMLRR